MGDADRYDQSFILAAWIEEFKASLTDPKKNSDIVYADMEEAC